MQITLDILPQTHENNHMSKQLSLTVTVMQLGIRASTELIQLLGLGPNLHSKWEAQRISNLLKKKNFHCINSNPAFIK